jgi:hypothetical protein
MPQKFQTIKNFETTYRRLLMMSKYKLPVDKNSIASQMNVQLGPDATSRQNGSVGGEMVRKTFESLGKW